jgi:hypothetical protein
MHDALMKMLKALVAAVKKGHVKKGSHNPGLAAGAVLSHELLRHLVVAGMNCPGFNERQKVQLLGISSFGATDIHFSNYYPFWPFLALGRRIDVPEDVLRVSSSGSNS